MFDILRHIKAGCIVVGRELNVLHANEMARAFFPRPNRPPAAFDFNDLPQVIGGKVFEVLKTGQPMADYHYQPTGAPGQHFQISITPFRKENSPAPTAALVVVEDCTAADRIRQLEIETANLRLVQQMAERLAHEIGNAVVPISTHQQLLARTQRRPGFPDLAGGGHGGKRQARQPAGGSNAFPGPRPHGQMESVPVKQLIEEAFREARAYHPPATVFLQYRVLRRAVERVLRPAGAAARLRRNHPQRPPGRHASCQVHVRTRTETDSSGSRWARIEVQDSGAGFSAEAAGKAAEPFFTTRKVGLGLGLAVTSKIIQTHAGKLEIPPPRNGSPA